VELKNLKSQDLQELIQEQIKSYILSMGLQGGDFLPAEKELTERLGISRTAVREALQGLETLGIIEARQGIGRFIREFNFEAILKSLPYSLDKDIKNFNDILEVRVCLEAHFLAKDLDKFTPADILELQGILARMRKQALHDSEERRLIEIHSEFHCALYRHSGNALLINLIKIFSTIQRNLYLLQRYRTKDREEFIKAHQLILAALEAGDPQLVKARMEEHFAEPMNWVRNHKTEIQERR